MVSVIELPLIEKKKDLVKNRDMELAESNGMVDLQVNGFGGVDYNSLHLTPEKLQKS